MVANLLPLIADHAPPVCLRGGLSGFGSLMLFNTRPFVVISRWV
jgi:hypothetical protein